MMRQAVSTPKKSPTSVFLFWSVCTSGKSSEGVQLYVIHIRSIHHSYVSGLHIATQLAHVATVMMICRIRDYAYRYEGDKIESDVYFCSIFIFSVFSPVHTFGYQFDSCRINSSDGSFESSRQPENHLPPSRVIFFIIQLGRNKLRTG